MSKKWVTLENKQKLKKGDRYCDKDGTLRFVIDGWAGKTVEILLDYYGARPGEFVLRRVTKPPSLGKLVKRLPHDEILVIWDTGDCAIMTRKTVSNQPCAQLVHTLREMKSYLMTLSEER